MTQKHLGTIALERAQELIAEALHRSLQMPEA